MRETSYVETKRPRRLRGRIVDAVTRRLPLSVFRKLMEHKFINFGVETTNICNADCTFCGYRFMQRPKKTMKWPIYEKAVREFAAAGGGSLNFTPTVGDPLVDKRLIDKIEFANSLPEINQIFLYTNGILLNRFDMDRFLKSGLTRLAISTFIGSREGYKHYYGKDKYDQVVINILSTAKRNQELGSPVRITLHLRVEGDKRRWYDTDAYKAMAELVGEMNIDYLDVYDAWGGLIKKEDVPEGTGLCVSLPIEEKIPSPCFELYRRVHVMADGRVGACVCVDLEGEIQIGDISKQTLEEIWHGNKLATYRSDWVNGKLPKVCQTCTRYQGIDDFIAESPKRVVIDYMRRAVPRLLNWTLR